MIARASQWTSSEVAAAVSGRLSGPDVPVLGVSTDTRDALKNCLFVALSGDRFDAHQFLDRAISGGAAAVLVSEEVVVPPHVACIQVEDTLFALGELARAHRSRMPARIVALTGSNGKTTTKEMLAAILSVGWRTLRTEGNLNNLIGVPMTLLGLASKHEAAVVEMGMNVPGEIARYTEIAQPEVGMVINVGPAHIGNLGSMEAIAQAKGELFKGLPSSGVSVVNANDPWVVRIADGRTTTVSFGSKDADVVLKGTSAGREGQNLQLEIKGSEVEAWLPFLGPHNALNAAAAAAAAQAMGAPLSWIAEGLPKTSPVDGRLRFESIGPYVVVDDCYNANAASMKAAIETVARQACQEGRRFVALLGEMRELGAFSDEHHREVGNLAAEHAAVVGAFGPMAKPMAARHEVEDVDALYTWFREQLRDGDFILVKGSRGIQMERFIHRLRKDVG